MGKRAVTIEWRIAKNDQEWGQWDHPPAPLVPGQRHRLRWLGEVLLLLLVVGGVGGWQWYTAQAEWQQVTTELTAAVRQEAAGLSQPGMVQSAMPGASFAPTIRLLALQGDQAIVAVTIPTIAQDPAYDQTQFYRRTPAGWQRTAPDAALWGSPQQQETASFRWHYRAKDAPVVAAVAPQLETFYTTARHNLGLVNVPQTTKLVIEVSVTQTTGYVSPWFGAAVAYRVASPALYRAPVALTDSELLLQSLALPLLNTVIAQAREHHGLPATWQPLLDGLRLWQLWELDLPLSPWRSAVVTWLYGGLSRADLGQKGKLPARYAELCAAHTLWLPSPQQIGVPLRRFQNLNDPLTRMESAADNEKPP